MRVFGNVNSVYDGEDIIARERVLYSVFISEILRKSVILREDAVEAGFRGYLDK